MTDLTAGDQPLSLLGRTPSPAFERRVVVLAAGATYPVVQAEWRDALVQVEHGEIAVLLSDGGDLHFARGDVLWLDGLPVRAVHNRGPSAALLVAIRRRQPVPAR